MKLSDDEKKFNELWNRIDSPHFKSMVLNKYGGINYSQLVQLVEMHRDFYNLKVKIKKEDNNSRQKEIEVLKRTLKNNKYITKSFEEHQDVATRLTHWKLYKNFDEYLNNLIITNRKVLALSNETDIDINESELYTESLYPSIHRDLERIGYNIEYDFGAFELYKK